MQIARRRCESFIRFPLVTATCWLIRVPVGGHRPFGPNPKRIDFTREMVRWFDRYLREAQEPAD